MADECCLKVHGTRCSFPSSPNEASASTQDRVVESEDSDDDTDPHMPGMDTPTSSESDSGADESPRKKHASLRTPPVTCCDES